MPPQGIFQRIREMDFVNDLAPIPNGEDSDTTEDYSWHYPKFHFLFAPGPYRTLDLGNDRSDRPVNITRSLRHAQTMIAEGRKSLDCNETDLRGIVQVKIASGQLKPINKGLQLPWTTTALVAPPGRGHPVAPTATATTPSRGIAAHDRGRTAIGPN